jgi:cell division transport system permease protein
LHQAFPQAHSDLLRGEKLAQALSPWLGEGRWETLLPPLLEVHLPSQQAPRVQAWLAQQPEVLLVQSSSQWSRQALQALSQGLRLAAALAGVMALAFGVLVVLTVRALVLSHADEIAIMRLIGAHEGKIRGPYLMANALIGLVGGVGAVALSLGAQAALAQILPLPVPPSSFLLAAALAGPLLGALGALVGLRSLPPEP